MMVIWYPGLSVSFVRHSPLFVLNDTRNLPNGGAVGVGSGREGGSASQRLTWCIGRTKHPLQVSRVRTLKMTLVRRMSDPGGYEK